jgi:hypothetical protein
MCIRDRLFVVGWSQEIEEPFRTATSLIVRLPFRKALVFGQWTGQLDEYAALTKAVQERVLADEDFSEEKGWTPAKSKPEDSIEDFEYFDY